MVCSAMPTVVFSLKEGEAIDFGFIDRPHKMNTNIIGFVSLIFGLSWY